MRLASLAASLAALLAISPEAKIAHDANDRTKNNVRKWLDDEIGSKEMAERMVREVEKENKERERKEKEREVRIGEHRSKLALYHQT